MSAGLQLGQLHAQLDYESAFGEVRRYTVHLELADAVDLHVLEQQSALDAVVGVPEDAPLVEVGINGVHVVLGHSLVPQLGGKCLDQAADALVELRRAETTGCHLVGALGQASRRRRC